MEVAGWFVSPIITKLIDTCFDYLGEKLKWPTRMKEELKRLKENHPKIEAIVSAASQAQKIDVPDPALNKWIWQLRDAIDEADDVLDDFEYIKHEEQLARNMEETKEGSSWNWSSLFGNPPKLRKCKLADKIDPNLERLEEVVHKLDKILTEADTFLHLLGRVEQVQQDQLDKLQNDRKTGSLPKDVLIGRDKDKDFIVQWLKKLPNEEHQIHVSAIPNMYHNISLLSVVSPGGMGKTTLLQHVYQHEITKVFDLKMWVCISNNFKVEKVIADMLESLQGTRPSLESSLDTLQNSLKSVLTSKKFLLVLDDIWEEDAERDKSKWETVLAPLAYGGLGSNILLTTRMSSAALMIAKVIKQKNEVLNLKGLEEDDCLQLLNTHAFASVENPNEHNKLRSIAGELVKKLYGSPLAAKVMGGVLNSNMDERHWTNVLNKDLGQNDIHAILKLSYTLLPKYLQNCFAFCSIFEQDHIFDKDDLIKMWIAVGFIQPSYIHGETLEDISERYFDILVKKSFFYKFDEGYQMHDLLHELAQSVSAQECLRIMGDEDSNLTSETIRHLSVETNNLKLLRKMKKFKNLRTLCISYDKKNPGFVDVLTENFKVTRSIRVLSITAYQQKMIPETIKCLKHLRYLNLEFSSYTLLPRSVSNLYHLQFLIIKQFSSHDDLFPRDMNNLSNLRYLRSNHLKFPGIGKLKFLQVVKGFVVKNETGYRIEELEHMKDLRILGIKGLENVRDAQEACNAKLCDKRKLTDLSLEWEATSQNITDLDIYARVLDNLQPHNNLKKLMISDYMGVRPAIWMNKTNNLINNLVCIKLKGCLEWQNLPPFGQLPFLKYLLLRDMPKAEWFDNKFHGKDINAGDDCLFPCLIKLQLYNCPNLQELPYLPPELDKLTAENMGWKTLNCCGISESFPLEKLQVRHCPNITNISLTSKIIGRSAGLRKVDIVDCPNLISLGGHQEVETTGNCPNLKLDDLTISDPSVLQMEPLRSVTSIKEFRIRDNDELVSFPFDAERWFLQVSSSLRELHFGNLKSLQSLPSSLTSLSSLETLLIWNIPELRELPDLPPSLCKLWLEGLDNLNCPPSCLPSLSSLTKLYILKVPQLRELPDLPPSLRELELYDLDNLNCLPSCLPSLSSLRALYIDKLPQLRELPDLPPSLFNLLIRNLDNLICLPSCLPSLSSLTILHIDNVPQLRELQDISPSLKDEHSYEWDPELMKRFKK